MCTILHLCIYLNFFILWKLILYSLAARDVFKFIRIYFMYRSSLWFKYGLMKNDQTLIVVNSTGAILCFMYMLLYYIYTLQKVNNFQVLFILLISNYQLQFPVSYQYLICCSWIFYVWIGSRWGKTSINNRKWVPKMSTDIAVPMFVPVVFEYE